MSNLYRLVRALQDDNYWRPTPDEVLDHIIRRRLRNNQNWVATICGETGAGKSYSALKIGEMIDSNFGAENVVFSAKEFLDSFEGRRAGSLVVFDEGQEWSARRAMSKKNVEMNEIMIMLRFTRVNVLFTVPNIRQIDIGLRRLMHSYLFVKAVDRTNPRSPYRERSLVYIYDVRNPRLPGGEERAGGVLYAHPYVPVVRPAGARAVKVGTMALPKPSQALLDAYERRKREVFQARLSQARATLAQGPVPSPMTPSPSRMVDEDRDLGERS